MEYVRLQQHYSIHKYTAKHWNLSVANNKLWSLTVAGIILFIHPLSLHIARCLVTILNVHTEIPRKKNQKTKEKTQQTPKMYSYFSVRAVMCQVRRVFFPLPKQSLKDAKLKIANKYEIKKLSSAKWLKSEKNTSWIKFSPDSRLKRVDFNHKISTLHLIICRNYLTLAIAIAKTETFKLSIWNAIFAQCSAWTPEKKRRKKIQRAPLKSVVTINKNEARVSRQKRYKWNQVKDKSKGGQGQAGPLQTFIIIINKNEQDIYQLTLS